MIATRFPSYVRRGLVAISPDKVVRVSTVQLRPEAEKWSPRIISTLHPAPQKWNTPGEVTVEGLAGDANDFHTGEPFDVDSALASSARVPRRPRLTHAKRIKLGLTPGRRACELILTGELAVPHTEECWKRVASIIEMSDEGQDALLRAESRIEQYHRIMYEILTPEATADNPAPATPVWLEDKVVDDKDSDDEIPSLGNISASIDVIHARYIETKPDGNLTKEGIRHVLEALDIEYAAGAQRRKIILQKKRLPMM